MDSPNHPVNVADAPEDGNSPVWSFLESLLIFLVIAFLGTATIIAFVTGITLTSQPI